MNDNTKFKLKQLRDKLREDTDEGVDVEEEKDAGEVRIKLSPRSKYLEKRLAGLSDLMIRMIDAITNKKMTVNVPDQVTVKNLGDIKIPSEVKISNLPEQKEIQKVEITNLPEQKDQAPAFKNFVTKATESIGNIFKDLWKDGVTIKQNEKKSPLYVMPVDEKGNVLRQKDIQVFGGGGSGLSKDDKQNLQNISDNTVKAAILKISTTLSASGAILTPATGKKIRIKSLKFTLTADQNQVAIKWGTDGAFEIYQKPKAGGLYGFNIPEDSIFEGAADTSLNCDIDGLGDVTINLTYQEI